MTPDQLASLLLSRKSIAACSAASGGGGDAAAMGAARQAPKNEATTALAIELWAAQDLTCPPPTTPSDAGTVHASARPRPARSREPSRPSLARAMAQFRMGNKSEESTCRLFQRRCWAPSSFFATRPPWCEPAAGAAGRLTRPAPSHRTCAWPSVAWSRCAARVALFSGGADGSYQVPSAATSGHSEPAEQGELLLIRVGQAAVRQLVATGRGRV